MGETTGARIRRKREQLVLGQSELARAAGLTHSALWHMERGSRAPRPATLRKLAEAMTQLSGKPVDALELVGDDQNAAQAEILAQSEIDKLPPSDR